MVTAKQVQSIRQQVVRTVREFVGGFPLDDSVREEMGQIPVKRDLTEADNHPKVLELSELGIEMCRAVPNLLRRGLVSRRSAADDRGDPCFAKLESVFARGTLWLICEGSLVKHGIHEVTGTVAREGSACPVGPVSARSEAEDEDPGTRVAKARNRPTPIGFLSVCAPFCLGNPLAIRA